MFSLAITRRRVATQEEVAQLREEVVRLRAQVVTITAAEQGARAQLDEDLRVEIRAVHAHLREMGQKVDEDRDAVLFEVAQMRESARDSTAAAAPPGLPVSPQTFAVPVAAMMLHLSQRKGFE